jgi:hypothetical protein
MKRVKEGEYGRHTFIYVCEDRIWKPVKIFLNREEEDERE